MISRRRFTFLTGASRSPPESLLQKVEIFRARGTIAPMEDEAYSPDQWRALFIGLGLTPESWPPAIESVAPEQIKEGESYSWFCQRQGPRQPTHDLYLAEIGAGKTG